MQSSGMVVLECVFKFISVCFSLALGTTEVVVLNYTTAAKNDCGPAIWGCIVLCCVCHFITTGSALAEFAKLFIASEFNTDNKKKVQLVHFTSIAGSIWAVVARYDTADECAARFNEEYHNLWIMIEVETYLFFIGLGLLGLACCIICCGSCFHELVDADRNEIPAVATPGMGHFSVSTMNQIMQAQYAQGNPVVQMYSTTAAGSNIPANNAQANNSQSNTGDNTSPKRHNPVPGYDSSQVVQYTTNGYPILATSAFVSVHQSTPVNNNVPSVYAQSASPAYASSSVSIPPAYASSSVSAPPAYASSSVSTNIETMNAYGQTASVGTSSGASSDMSFNCCVC